jgi:hypothetical protein
VKVAADSIEELIAKSPRPDEMLAIDAFIRATAPQLPRRLFSGPSITMIGYGEMSWAAPSDDGASGDEAWPVIGLTAQKRHIALYVAAERDGVTLAEHYRDRLGKTNNGKGCIRFTRLANVDRE